jgi:hypothetical protein
MSNSLDNFTLYINSTNYLERFTSLNDQSYSFNADNIEPGKYKIQMSYRGGDDPAATISLAQYASIYVSFGSVADVYTPGNTNNFKSTQCVGHSLQYVTGTVLYCYAETRTNPPTYINYSPSNVIRITLRSGLTNNLYGGTANYSLFLQFSKCD